MQEEVELKQRLFRRYIMVGCFIVLLGILAYLIYILVQPSPVKCPAGSRSSTCTASQTKQTAKPAKTAGPKPTTPAGSLNSSQTGSNTNSASGPTTGQSAAAPNGSTSQLSNTGPGNVIGLFFAVSLAVTALHFLISKKRTRAERT